MNSMQIAYTKAIIKKTTRGISRSGKSIGNALKSIYTALNNRDKR